MIKESIVLLKKQLENFTHLHEIVAEKQDALTGTDHRLLADVISREEKLLLAIRTIESERASMIRKFMGESVDKDNPKQFKLSSIYEGLITNEELEDVRQTEAAIKDVVQKIDVLNKKNLFLIKHLRSFINETLLKVLKNQRKSIVDKKV